MKKNLLLIIAIGLFIAVAFTSCETATGTGAVWGATTGAVLGAAASGNARGAAVGGRDAVEPPRFGVFLRQARPRLALRLPQSVDDGLRFVGHPEQLGPRAMIIFARQLPRRVEPHVRSDVL